MSKGFSVFTAFKAKDGLTPAFKSMTRGANALSNNVNKFAMKIKTFGSCVQSTCQKVNMLANVFVTGFVFGKLRDYVKTTTDAAEQELAAQAKLTQVLKNNSSIRAKGANAYLKISQELFDFASEIQKKGIIGDEVLVGAMQGLGSMGFDDKIIRKMTPIIADLAVQQKGYNVQIQDTEQISKQLGRALAGNVGGLSRMGVVLTSIQQKQIKNMRPLERANYIYDLLAKRVGGLNEKFAQTDRGAKIQALNNLSDRLEDIGKKIIPIEGHFWKFVNKSMPQISTTIDVFFRGFEYIINGFKPVFNELKNTFKIFSTDVGGNFSELTPIFKNLFKNVLVPGLVLAIATFNKLIKIVNDTYNIIKFVFIPILPILSGFLAGLAVFKTVQYFQALRVQFALCRMEIMKNLIPAILKTIPVIWASSRAFLANPIFWIPAAIAAVVAAIILLWKHWDSVTAKAKEWADWLTGSTIGKIISCMFPIVGILALMIKNWDKITEAIINFGTKCKEIFSNITEFVKNGFLTVLNHIFNFINSIINSIKNISSSFGMFGNNKFNINTPKTFNLPQPPINNNAYSQNNSIGGVIEVKNIIENRNNSHITSNMNLLNSHNLTLNPA